jgi:protein SCO1/2
VFKRAFYAGLMVWAALAAGCAAAPAATPTAAGPADITVINPPKANADFMLTDQTGEIFHLSDLKGKIVLMAFGYTHCPDVCPITLARFKQIKEKLGADADRLAFMWVSVDGKRDTPARIAQYIAMFDPAFIALTGESETVREIITEYGGVFVINDSAGLRKENYTVDHTASHFLLDADGRWIRTYSYGAPVDTIVADLQKLLAQG